jgi:hypothetical protein
MANSIYQRQNQPEILKCLVVQRRLYSSVKYWQLVPAGAMVASIVVPLCFEKSTDGCGVGDWVAVVISVFVWVSTGLLGMLRDSIVKMAAGVQQYVDCKLFSGTMGKHFEWKGMLLPSEIARLVSNVTQEDVEREKVRDWYSDYSTFSGQYAVLCCQKENVRWDRSLRVLLLVVLLIILVVWIVWAIVQVFDVTLRCALPILCWCGGGMVMISKLCLALRNDVVRINGMRDLFERTEKKIIKGVDSAKELMQLQNLIYEHRKSVVLVPDVVYKLSRGVFQAKEDSTAKCHREMLS